jgi:endo-1,4-beta-xylanase
VVVNVESEWQIEKNYFKGIIMTEILLNKKNNSNNMARYIGSKRLGSVVILFISISLLMIFSPKAFAQSDTIETNVPALKDVYAKDFTIGCLLSYRNIGFSTDSAVSGQSAVATPNGGYLIKFHMNCMSPGNNMKPQYTVNITASAAAYNSASTSAAKDSIDTHPIISFNGDLIAQLNWARRQKFTFRGHTLVWHSQTPTELFRSGYTANGTRLSKEKMIQRMDNYIHEVVRLIHQGWPGLLSAIDVVNEAINDDGTDRTTDSEWYVTFGDNSYLMKAFELARKNTVQYGETQIKLYYNDYNTNISNKADGIVRICKPIYQAGYLDGIGMQEHDANSSPNAAEWIASYNKFDGVCNEMSVTEFDVTTGSASPSTADLTTQANQYGMLFKCFVERSYKSGRGKIINVSKDGLNDAYTFKTNQSSSLWNASNKCKPSFYAVADVGKNYDGLDSLITYAGSLKEKDYTSATWLNLSTILSAAKIAKTQNYSNTISAASTLGDAKTNLKTAVNGLVKITTTVKSSDDNLPKTYSLSQNYPNPFNPTTQICYSIPKDEYVSLKVYNLLGEEVAVLTTGFRPAGNYVVTFNGSKFASGIYFYRLKADEFVETKKLILSK